MNYLYALAVAAAACAGSYFYGVHEGSAREKGALAREELVAQKARDAALQVTADAIAAIKVENKTIYGRVEREVRTNTIYAECKHPPEQLQRINDALAGAGAKPAGKGVVP